MVWLLILINAAVFAVELGLERDQFEAFAYAFGIVPSHYFGGGSDVGIPTALRVWPFLTYMFVHGSWLHIIGNMWTLWIFGDNVEDRMGSFRFLVFYILCGLAAAVTQLFTHSQSTIPTIGASGAIAGVLAAYLLLYPRAGIIVMVPLFFWPFFFELPAVIYMGVWFFTQVFSGMLVLGTASEGGVAWWAHIGGFVAGLALCPALIIGRKRRRRMYADEYGVEGAWSRYRDEVR